MAPVYFFFHHALSRRRNCTPGEVGLKRNPQVFMRPGDTVDVEVSQIGVLTNKVETLEIQSLIV